ncbi:MAG: hypothetical protein ABII09_03630 [Planctomycetota bacterium]
MDSAIAEQDRETTPEAGATFHSAPPRKAGLRSAPSNACVFRETSIIGFTDDEGANNQRFRIVAYSGQIIVNHWYWGNLAFDLQGIKFDKKKTPILEEHARSIRLGFTTMQEVAESVVVEGKFLSSEPAQKIRKDMVEGFPMQASVYNVPAVIERVEQGASVMVNGQQLDGPGTVFRKSTIYEVSLCCLGADNETSGEVFDKDRDVKFDLIERTIEMETKTKLTAETFAAEYPELLGQIQMAAKAEGKTEGGREAREQFAEFAKRFGKDPAFCIEQFKAGATLEAAMTAYTAKLEQKNADLAEQAKKAAETKAKTDPAIAAFSDDAGAENNKGKVAATTEEGWAKEYDESKKLQEEFGGDKDAYVAFKKNEDRIRIKKSE